MRLKEPYFRPFPLKAVTPSGWLSRQLRIQADGLSGHLDEFWPDIKDSAWIGGSAEGWERMPYWLDGVIPLAWLTNATALKIRITGYLDAIIERQQESGWLGPGVEDAKEASDLWSQALAMKMLIGFHNAAGDKRIIGVVKNALRNLDRHIDVFPLSYWGQFRWFEFLIPVWWLYEKTKEPWLLDLAVKLHAQGFNWNAFFQRWPLRGATEKDRWNFAGHVVNNAMAVKEGGLWWRLTGSDADRNAAYSMITALDKYHGAPTGVFTGDECLAGTGAVQGTELCAVAEFMYSLICLAGILGDAALADRLEMITFNALPATFSPDMWAHQYVQQVNQIECSVRENRPWNTNGPDANIFGLEPNFGCCTANLSQAWPKFAAHLWMRTKDGGIAAVAHAPSTLHTDVGGVPVLIALATDYPFRPDLHYTITVEKPVSFSFFVRIPGWAKDAVLEIDGKPVHFLRPGEFHHIERIWKDTTTLTLTLPMTPETIPRNGSAVSIKRGPLIYALKIGEDWRRINADRPLRELPHADWEVYPTTPWNYALKVGEKTIIRDIVFRELPMRTMVFSPETPPVEARVTGRRLADWTAQNGSAGPVPPGPVQTDAPPEPLTLIPYGCTNLRIAEFPVTAGGKKTI